MCRVIFEHNEDGTVVVSSNSHEAEVIAVDWKRGTYTRVPVQVSPQRVDDFFTAVPRKTDS
jgi:hypothetical protein